METRNITMTFDDLVLENESLIDTIPESDIYEVFHIRQYDLIIIYIPIILLSLSANLLVITVVIKNHYMRSVTNYFLVNLSVADLLVTLLCMPMGVWSAYTMLWNFGEIVCKVTNYLQCVSVASSVFTITAMALDRYLAIIQPFGFYRWFNKKTTVVVIILMWLAPMILFAPLLVLVQIHEDRIGSVTLRFCYENWNGFIFTRKAFGIVCYIVMFAVPGFIMLCAYSLMGRTLCSVRPPFDVTEGNATAQQNYRLVRERKRVAWILLLLAILFAICWLPHNTLNLLTDTNGGKFETEDINTMAIIKRYMLLLGHVNSALNPIIYCIMSRNFRKSVKELIFRTKTNFESRKKAKRNQWVESSSSSHHRQQVEQLRFISSIRKTTPLTRLQSSQRTTKTCAV
ncbi:orexin receptor type 2-like isoform X2 [Agrilus planipennis]|uniref:Orexin receptor type 2-like isoform X2 n=1 Tax=Agrilus planipennis TaxID=224129 RepID=A0A1W4WZW7_AGRPL|nr:orexin receptor type 2-like isoform X2 [Agrilus planipennis]